MRRLTGLWLLVLAFISQNVGISCVSAGEAVTGDEGRVNINWGDPELTEVDDYLGVDDSFWCLGAYKSGGFWLGGESSSWYAPVAEEGVDIYQSLAISFDRELLQDKVLGFDVSFYAFAGSVLEVDVFDIDGECIGENVTGNVVCLTNEPASEYFEISFADYPDCAEIRMAHVSGAILIYETSVSVNDSYILSDVEEAWDLSEQELVAPSVLASVVEVRLMRDGFADVSASMTRDVFDGTVYVSASVGSAMYDGYGRLVADGHGPKRGIQQGMDVCEDGGTVEIEAGGYVDSVLSPGNKTIILKINGTVTL